MSIVTNARCQAKGYHESQPQRAAVGGARRVKVGDHRCLIGTSAVGNHGRRQATGTTFTMNQRVAEAVALAASGDLPGCRTAPARASPCHQETYEEFPTTFRGVERVWQAAVDTFKTTGQEVQAVVERLEALGLAA